MSSDNAPDQSLSVSDLASALPADSAGLVNVLKDKLQTLAGQHSSLLEFLTPDVRKRVTALQEIQAQYDELEKKFFEERSALEARFQKLYAPLFTKRYEIVNGITDVQGVTEEKGVGQDASAEQKKVKGVPEFWLSAMKTNDRLSMQITERDEEGLKYLKDIRWSRMEDPKGFKLEFLFDTNPFFKNTVLIKEYHMMEEDDPILERAIGTEVEWHAGKNLTQKVMRKKVKKGDKNTKPMMKTTPCESFFNFFSPPKVPEDDEEIDQEKAEELQDMMEQDYDIGSTIRDKLIPHAVSWYTGEAAEGEEFEDMEDSGDMEDEDEEEDDEDEEEDGSEGAETKKR